MKPDTVHRPTAPAIHRSEPVLDVMTLTIGPRSMTAVSRGSVWRKVTTARCAAALCPSTENTAAAVMKNGNSVISAR